jgi:uncharacterized protein
MSIVSAAAIRPPIATQARVPWREVVCFCALAYAFTWAWDAIWLAPHLGTLLAGGTTPPDGTAVFGNMLNHLPAMLGPGLAALVMRVLVSREGLGGSAGLRRSWRYYLIALLAPVAVIGAAAALLALAGQAHLVPPGEPLTLILVLLLAVLLLPEIVLAFGEEYGWRGYLLPRLLPLGEVRATLLIGPIWSLWHLPVLISGTLLGGNALWVAVVVHLVAVTLGSFAYTWLGRATRHSPAVAAVYHGSTNWFQQRLVSFLAVVSLPVTLLAIGLLWLPIIVLVYVRRRSAALDNDSMTAVASTAAGGRR